MEKIIPSFRRPDKRPETQGTGRARGHASREADRASEASPSANTRQQEACDLSYIPWRATGHGQSLLPEAGPCLRVPRKGRARAERATSQFPAISAAEDALEETHPFCWRASRQIVVYWTQNAVFFDHNFIFDGKWNDGVKAVRQGWSQHPGKRRAGASGSWGEVYRTSPHPQPPAAPPEENKTTTDPFQLKTERNKNHTTNSSGGATTSILTVTGANAVSSSLCILPVPWNMVLSPDNVTSTYRMLRMPKSRGICWLLCQWNRHRVQSVQNAVFFGHHFMHSL